MNSLGGKVALVTGAGSGIGRATALALAREQAKLILCDINEDALKSVAAELGPDACLMTRRIDVSKRGEMQALADAVHERVPALDVLVNNAGVYVTGGILDLSLDDWDWVLSIDLWGVIHGTHFFVPKMAARAAPGHVVNLSSMFGYWIGPNVIGYLTAKFGVFGFSEALREDLRGTGINVSTVCPGMINTNLVQSTRFRNSGNEDVSRSHLEATYQRRDYGPEKVATAIVRAIRHNRRLVLVSPEARIMYHVQRLCPPLGRTIARIVSRRMFR